MRKADERKLRQEQRAQLEPDERRLRALEDISDSLVEIRAALTDISLWVAHIGRNWRQPSST
jgi:hypothetical protein